MTASDVVVSYGSNEPSGPSPYEQRAQEQARVLNAVGKWLKEQSSSTRVAYADVIGYPVNLTTGRTRDARRLRNGVTWLVWCADNDLHPLTATRDDVHDWLEVIQDMPHPTSGKYLAKSTRTLMLSAASSFYRWCTEEGLIAATPVTVNRKKRGLATGQDKSPTRSLDRTEVAALQDAADHDRISGSRLRSAAIVATLFGVGMRVSELTGLHTDEMAVMQGKRVLWLWLKGNRQHVVELPGDAAVRIDHYLAARADLEQRPVKVGEPGGRRRPLLVTATGRPMHRSEVLRLLKRLARQAGIEQPDQIHPHVARHTWITTAREVGIDAGTIQEHVGHLDGTTTARYGHHVLTVKEGVSSKVSAAYASAREVSVEERVRHLDAQQVPGQTWVPVMNHEGWEEE